MNRARLQRLKAPLEALYAQYNRPAYLHPDPLEMVVRYDDPRDQEIAGFLAAALAFGQVRPMLRAIETVLERLPRPHAGLLARSPGKIAHALAPFRYRFVTETEVEGLLRGLRGVLRDYGSIEYCFGAMLQPGDEDVLGALTGLCEAVRAHGEFEKNYLLPDPCGGSACKRLLMYLRWMVRRDAVDPGPWERVPAKLLLVPLDTHLHRAALGLGLTKRATAGMATVREVTRAFRVISPDDPARYDFALTRLGIRDDANLDDFLAQCGKPPI